MVSSRSTAHDVSPQTSTSITPDPIFPLTNGSASFNGTTDLTLINNKPLHYRAVGSGSDSVVFVHGLGGSIEFWTPLIAQLDLESSHKLHLFDFEGHGLSPTHPLSALSIQSLSSDTAAVLKHAGASSSAPATLVAHSMGCLVALHCALSNPSLIKKLILVGPPPSPLPEAATKGTYARAATVRAKGMGGVVDAVAGNGTSARSKKSNPQGVAAARISLLGTDPEAYAKACMALAGSSELSLEVEKLTMPTLIITGDEDKVSPPELCEKYATRISTAEKPVALKEVGHWHVFEDTRGVADAVAKFLQIQFRHLI
jgi:pimeloyl-ACP methyl ester carboxylesterase